MERSRAGAIGMKLAIMAAAPVVAMTSAPPAGFAQERREHSVFTLVVLPDSQLAVQNKPELFSAETEWIVAHRRDLNIPFVVHLGDVVEWPSRTSDWERTTAALSRLDRVVPYVISVGNHDFDAWACTPPETCDPNQYIATDRSTTMFNRYFPWCRFARQPGFRDAFPPGRSDDTAVTFRAGGLAWLVVSVKYRPTDEELAWADRIIARHPGHRVIINTHEYQYGNDRSETGERIWNTLARKHRNVRFVLSGHYTTAGRRVDRGDAGNAVYQIQADYQTYSIPLVDENGYLRLMSFDTGAGTLSVRTFSPYCEATGECPAYKTDPDNEFDLAAVELD